MPEAGPAEHELLRQSVRDFVTNTSPEAEVRRLMAAPYGFDREVWSIMAGQLGLQGMAIPERYGGAGFGWAEPAIVFEEFGRALLCAPYFATVALAVPALLGSDDHSAHLYLKRAKSSQLLFGSPQQHRAALADLVRSAA
jgi:alkylation response protein AidB-like acyl-CoA dehydrogenase